MSQEQDKGLTVNRNYSDVSDVSNAVGISRSTLVKGKSQNSFVQLWTIYEFKVIMLTSFLQQTATYISTDSNYHTDQVINDYR